MTSLLRGAAVEGCGTMISGGGVMQRGGRGQRGRSVVDWAAAAESGKAEREWQQQHQAKCVSRRAQ